MNYGVMNTLLHIRKASLLVLAVVLISVILTNELIAVLFILAVTLSYSAGDD